MTEDELLTGLLGAARAGGWLVHHVRRSDSGIQQGDPGFPDLVAAHLERRAALAIEAKSASGRVTPEQTAWLEAFRACGFDARVVRPADYDQTWRYIVGYRLKVTAHTAGKWGRSQEPAAPRRRSASKPASWCYLCGANHHWDECPLTIAERAAVMARRAKRG